MAGIATTGPLPPTGSAQDPPSSSIGQPSSASRGIDGTAALQSPPPADPKSDMVNHDAAPKSLVAGGTEYPNVPDTAPGQAGMSIFYVLHTDERVLLELSDPGSVIESRLCRTVLSYSAEEGSAREGDARERYCTAESTGAA